MYWEAFLRVGGAFADEAPAVDEAWSQMRGLSVLSPSVIRRLRRDVLPLVREMQARYGVWWFSFLIHDRDSGVPAEPGDRDAYVHLRFALGDDEGGREWRQDEVAQLLPDWQWVRPIELSEKIAGIDETKLTCAWDLLHAQAHWMLQLIEAHKPEVDDAVVLQHLRQFLHFFANMAQMRVA